MKTLRKVLYVIVAILLGIFINALTLTLIFKNIVQDGIITNTIKTSLVSGYLSKNISEINNLPEDKKKLLEEFLNDNELNEVVDVLINNYVNYKDNNYKISQSDVDKIKDYIVKNKSLIEEATGEKVDIDKIKDEITVDKIDERAKELYDKFEDMPSTTETAFEAYKFITVGPLRFILIGIIVLCIVLLMLLSWSFVKWMKATGVCFISNGVLISLLFIFIDGIKDLLLKKSSLNLSLNNMSFNYVLIIGIIELVLGIVLVVTYNLLNKKSVNNKTTKPIIEAEVDSSEEISEE